MRFNAYGGINICDEVEVNIIMKCPLGSVELILQNIIDETKRKGCSWMRGSGMGINYSSFVQFTDKDKKEKWDNGGKI